MRARQAWQMGASGSSLISQPASDRAPLVEQVDEQARHARLRLAALAEEDDVLPARTAFSICGTTVSS